MAAAWPGAEPVKQWQPIGTLAPAGRTLCSALPAHHPKGPGKLSSVRRGGPRQREAKGRCPSSRLKGAGGSAAAPPAPILLRLWHQAADGGRQGARVCLGLMLPPAMKLLPGWQCSWPYVGEPTVRASDGPGWRPDMQLEPTTSPAPQLLHHPRQAAGDGPSRAAQGALARACTCTTWLCKPSPGSSSTSVSPMWKSRILW